MLDADYAVIGSATLLKQGLNVPDGVAISTNKQWLGISNHDDHTVYIYQNHIRLNPQSLPNAILHGVSYAHGIKFYGNDHYIFVTDAGSPFVFVFFNPSSQWQGSYQPAVKVRVMDDKLFNQCHTSPEEGGNKGLFIDEKRSLLMISCEQTPLACFDINAILNQLPNQTVINAAKLDGLNDQDKLTRLVNNMRLDGLKNNTYFSEQIDKLNHMINNLLKSKSWKMTYPLRYMNYLVKKII